MAEPFNDTDPVRKTYFINQSERSADPTDDEGFVPQLEEDGKVSTAFFYQPDFGDGRDGNVTISSPTTLTRDMYYNDLVVNAALSTDGYRIYVNGTLSGSGSIDHNGGNGGNGGNGVGAGAYGSGGPGAASTGAGVFKTGAGSNGGAGNTPNGVVGAATIAANYLPLSVPGGKGGNGSSNSGNGALAGTITAVAELAQMNPSPKEHYGFGITSAALIEFIKKCGGGGGGGGGRNTSFANERSGGGGGGGASGGIVWIACRAFNGSFNINCNGGNGGNGGSNGGSGGGGGGGGGGGHGGLAVIHYVTKAWTGVFSASGGTGGTAGSGGSGTAATNGSNASAGTLIEVLV